MEEYSSDQWVIINKGVELFRAFYDLAPAWMRRTYDEQSDANATACREARLPEGADKLPTSELARLATEQLQIAMKGFVEPEIAAEMRDRLIAAVRRGTLKAYGVPEKPTPRQEYVELPLTMLEERFFKWRQSRVEDRTYAFRSVRVMRAASRRAPSKEPRAQPVSKESAAARRKRLTIEAFQQIRKKLPTKHTKAQVVGEVVKVLMGDHKSDFAGGRGTDYDTICRHLKGQDGF